ncbi:hypothetical protein PUNSTDRAFT_134493 [Punctularia strigosozonata HHB-11173 SS5]|uniref:uncharacterized protein n=1 Tax=Punctularia strigosozonata (strain HHB-11173) TaxID=741275 RepID=UPI000441841A|nr:uncharacterized protein PUNSTDRAFT_134493 [Punctularia strigosozonata HHB-11173 SS5]EIN09340.1 hypothetical protein PUNSTDRAFT_134493 [Punctularia strigosozonata HHB-11173 SS5]
MPKAPKEAFYAVRRGIKQGVYDSWDEAKKYVLTCPDAKYKKFKTRDEAHAFAFAIRSTPASTIVIKRECSTQRLPSTPSASQVPKVVFYGVQKGRQQGVFESWDEVQKQVKDYPDAKHRCFCTREEAEEYVSGTWQSQPTERWSDTPTQCIKAEENNPISLASDESDSDSDFGAGIVDSSDSDSDSDIEILPDAPPSTRRPPQSAPALQHSRLLAIKQESGAPKRQSGVIKQDPDEPPSSQVQKFFEKLPGIRSLPQTKNYVETFHQLSQTQGWTDRRVKYERTRLKQAYTTDFCRMFGTDPTCLRSWQDLCRAIGTREEDIPHDLVTCRALIRSVHVNIFHLVDYKILGTPVKRFSSLEALASYCRKYDMFFPKKWAKDGSLLHFFLRKVLGAEV